MYQAPEVDRKRNPRQGTNVFSVLTFWFTRGIFAKTRKKELDEDDIYEVLDNTNATKLGDILEEKWNLQRSKVKASLWKAIFGVFGREYMLYGVLNLFVRTAVMIIRPISTGKLVSYFTPESPMLQEEAWFYASMVILSSIVMSFYTHYYLFSLAHFGLRVKVALASLVYRKSLKLTSSSLAEVTNGKIVNLVSKDVNVFETALMYGHDLWTGCIQAIVMAVIMYRVVGVSAVIGIVLMFLTIPFQVYMGNVSKRLRGETAARTDQRLRRIQEILTHIKIIKFHAWESYYSRITNVLRSIEINKLRKIFYVKATLTTVASLGYKLSFLICVLAYSLLGNTLTPESAFVVVTCYKSLEFLVSLAIPMFISQSAEARTSVQRMRDFLLARDVDELQRFAEKSARISLVDVDVVVGEKKVLKGVNFEAVGAEVVGLTGSVGGGKTTFLETILQDLTPTKGKVDVSGQIGYVSQKPWLFPETIRQNVLFGEVFDQARYHQVLDACCLLEDIETFPEKDLTVLNDNGTNLSTGQQMRIALARAVYKDRDIYLLDDVLAALDSKVAQKVFEKCIRQFLGDKLCILVCQDAKFLKAVDRVVVLESGRIGKFVGDLEEVELRSVVVEEDKGEDSALLGQRPGVKVYQESKKSGSVSFSTYKKYFEYAGGWALVPLVVFICAIARVSSVFFDYYLTVWLKTEQDPSSSIQRRRETLLTYVGIVGTCALSAGLESFTFFTLTSRASKQLHRRVFEKIMSATMEFYHRNLAGSILNRLSKDVTSVDEYLPFAYLESIKNMFLLIAVLSIIIYTNYFFVVPALVLLVSMVLLRTVYLRTSRSIKRLEGTTRAPVVGFINSTLKGLATIRSLRNEEVLAGQFEKHQDLNSSASYMFMSVTRAFAFWLDLMCSGFIMALVVGFILLQDQVEIVAGNVGLALTQSFGLARLLQWGIRQWAEMETITISVERIVEYLEAPQETIEGVDPNNWPINGKVEFRNVCLRYPGCDEDALKDISFCIEPQQKVAIVGRTGSGKSSLVAALLRLYDFEGTILVDDVNVKSVELIMARSNISVIPQDPVMFEGTIRSNLDPYDEYTDIDIWRSLSYVDLKLFVENMKLGLSSNVETEGANFSLGQRQLFCMAHAILRGNKILVLDEATANVDFNTDEIIQKVVQELFANCTVITIAHRIDTIIRSHKVVVVDGGRVVEVDDPQSLLSRRSLFYEFAKTAGLVKD